MSCANFSGDSALHEAARAGKDRLVALLVKAGDGTVDIRDWGYATPLMHAAGRADASAAVDVLIEAGANVAAADGTGKQPLHYAATAGNTEAIKALLAGGADRAAPCYKGLTPAEYATDEAASGLLEPLPEPEPEPEPGAAPGTSLKEHDGGAEVGTTS